MVADGTRADFVAVHDHVILVSHNSKFLFVGRCRGQRLSTTAWHTERVVTEVNFLIVCVPFVERKINNPGQSDDVRIFQVKMIGKVGTQATKHFIDHGAFVSAKEDGIAIPRAHFRFDGR